MKIEINIEKKHLTFFGIFIIIIGSIFVLGGYDEYGHTASEIGPGTIMGPITVLTPVGDGDGLKGVTQTSGSSSIYGFVQEGLFAYSGYFEGGDVAIYDKKLLFKNQETIIERSTVSVGIEGTNLVFEDGAVGQKTLSELVADGASSPWLSNGNDIYYNNGKVGIGTTNPTVELEVDGEISATHFSGWNLSEEFLAHCSNGVPGVSTYIQMGEDYILNDGRAFCFLTRFHVSDFDTNGDDLCACKVQVNSVTNRWEVRAVSGNDANCECYARCVVM